MIVGEDCLTEVQTLVAQDFLFLRQPQRRPVAGGGDGVVLPDGLNVAHDAPDPAIRLSATPDVVVVPAAADRIGRRLRRGSGGRFLLLVIDPHPLASQQTYKRLSLVLFRCQSKQQQKSVTIRSYITFHVHQRERKEEKLPSSLD